MKKLFVLLLALILVILPLFSCEDEEGANNYEATHCND